MSESVPSTSSLSKNGTSNDGPNNNSHNDTQSSNEIKQVDLGAAVTKFRKVVALRKSDIGCAWQRAVPDVVGEILPAPPPLASPSH
jgi:hypothetical protein